MVWAWACLTVTAPSAEVSYLRDVKPVLQERCYACHGALKQKAGLRVDTAERIHLGGKDGGIISPDRPDDSELLRRLTHPDESERMPPEGKPLTDAQIAMVRAWIAAGAPVPPGELGDQDPLDHWAFQRIVRPPIPSVDATAQNPIDAFLAAKQAEHHLQPQREASRSILIRRLYLDLIGLQPSPTQLQDSRPWETIVDELLTSPHHGERWGRHWMDIWRYSDWYGLGAQLRYSQKHLWRWRDWIIESLNQDKGYDQMILEMLAGDELAPADPEVIRATGFLARNYYLFNRTTWLDTTIEHTSKAFLGLTVNCAKCHDHKYDPISMVDYYRFRAIFEPHQVRLDPVPGEVDLEKDGLPRVFDDHPEAPTYLHLRGDPKNPDKSKPIPPGVPELFASYAPAIQPVDLPVTAYAPSTRDYVRQDQLQAGREKIKTAQQSLQNAQEKLAQFKQEPSEPSPSISPPLDEDSWQDEFDEANPERWDIQGDGWQYRDGALHQTQDTREKQFARLRGEHPRDFEVSCRYITTGGSTYKSVTIWFDRSDDGQEGHMVYTSAHQPDPKVQIAHTQKGQQSYPENGRVNRSIQVGEPYTLKFAVRDHLINVWLNNEFVMAYRLPRRMAHGTIALSAFDATAAFESFTLRPLPPNLRLTDAQAGQSQFEEETRESAARAVRVAEAQLAARETELEALQSSLDADRARFMPEETASDESPSQIAAQLEIKAKIARAQVDVLSHENGDEEKLKKAKAALADAQQQGTDLEKQTGDYHSIRASKKALESPADKEEQYSPFYTPQSTGRRLALAQWMASRENPLTARVAVNHVWMRHFGEPLVETVFDFGRRAPRPVHVDLLDYLAMELIESDWSLRHLHRLMVTSEAYRRRASNADADAETLAKDPSNHYYWRMNSGRMESQIIRDNLLHLAGALDLQQGGPSINPQDANTRRSLYLQHSRDQQDKFLDMFDDADHLQCYRRSQSIVPQQALALSNSKLSLEMAEKIAARIESTQENLQDDDYVEAAFEMILSRPPEAGELSECREFQSEMTNLLTGGKPPSTEQRERIRVRLIHVLLNHNDFVTIR